MSKKHQYNVRAKSTRGVHEFAVSQATTIRIKKTFLKLKLKQQLIQALCDGSEKEQVEFCKWTKDGIYLSPLIFSR